MERIHTSPARSLGSGWVQLILLEVWGSWQENEGWLKHMNWLGVLMATLLGGEEPDTMTWVIGFLCGGEWKEEGLCLPPIPGESPWAPAGRLRQLPYGGLLLCSKALGLVSWGRADSCLQTCEGKDRILVLTSLLGTVFVQSSQIIICRSLHSPRTSPSWWLFIVLKSFLIINIMELLLILLGVACLLFWRRTPLLSKGTGEVFTGDVLIVFIIFSVSVKR